MRAHLVNRAMDDGYFSCQIRKEPLLQVSGTDSLTVIFESNCPIEGFKMSYSTGHNKTIVNINDALFEEVGPYHYVYHINIVSLVESSKYKYELCAFGKCKQYSFFHPGPSLSPLKVAFVADSQLGMAVFHQICGKLSQLKPHYIVHAGDLIQRSYRIQEWQTFFFDVVNSYGLSQSIPFIIAQGNHDVRFSSPPPYLQKSTYFSAILGGSKWIILDSNSSTASQLNWLEEELSSHSSIVANFRIVVVHVAPFEEYWEKKAWNRGEKYWPDHVRLKFVPLFEKYNVDLVLCGHVHVYQRGSLNNVTYLVGGGAGGMIDSDKVDDWNMYKVTYLNHHYISLHISSEFIKVKTFSLQSSVIDEFSLERQHFKV